MISPRDMLHLGSKYVKHLNKAQDLKLLGRKEKADKQEAKATYINDHVQRMYLKYPDKLNAFGRDSFNDGMNLQSSMSNI